jgi:hypothetical protein
VELWDKTFNLNLLKVENIIIVGDHNFSLDNVEVWGLAIQENPLIVFF